MFRREKVPLDESLSSARRTVELFWNDLRQNGEQLGLEWTVVAMARRCGMGVTHFIHQTKQLVNMTPAHYLTRCRLEAAAKMLREAPEANVTEIALRFGFSSSQYFATQFRRQFDCTPSDYRSVIIIAGARTHGSWSVLPTLLQFRQSAEVRRAAGPAFRRYGSQKRRCGACLPCPRRCRWNREG